MSVHSFPLRRQRALREKLIGPATLEELRRRQNFRAMLAANPTDLRRRIARRARELARGDFERYLAELRDQLTKGYIGQEELDTWSPTTHKEN